MLTDEDRDRDFPTLREMTYLNTAAEGIPLDAAREALETYHHHKSQGMSGRDALFAEEAACKEAVGRFLQFKPEEVAFASSTSEAYNLLASVPDFSEGGEAVITDLDFPAGASPWFAIPSTPVTRVWANRNGVLELDDLEPLLSDRTRLVQVSLVSFLTGYRIPWAPFRDLVRRAAPQAILAVDTTQAMGRVELDCLDADCIFASTYKWLLGVHGGCIVVVPERSAEKVTVQAGGWYNLVNAFDADRFERAEPFHGAKGFAAGMPPFPAIFPLRKGIDYLAERGVGNIARHADALVEKLHAGLAALGIRTMSPPQPDNSSGIVSFQSENDAAIHDALLEKNIHVMHQAGRLRISIHGYNREEEIDALLNALRKL